MAILKKSKKTETTTEAPKASPSSQVLNAPAVLLRAIVSEKSTMNEGRSVYTFQVIRTATKIDVKNAVRMTYGVSPTMVRMINMEGKQVRFGQTMGRRSDWKKAMVTLPKGTTLDVHEGV